MSCFLVAHFVIVGFSCSEDPEGKAAIDAFYVLSMWLEGLGIKVNQRSSRCRESLTPASFTYIAFE